ncbi:MAG TPA: DivIVA domain-containing protein [Acidimicrobiales bacterium]|nr:DivIVA domain-containing protein [Acidimicrobiales bacterium]
MDVSPDDIRDVRFRERLRGYNPEDVDRFVERVADVVELLQQRLREAVARAARPESVTRPRPAEDGAGHTLQLAQRAAELVLHDAETEASRLVREAQERARAMVYEAEERAVSTAEEARSALQLDVSRLELARDRLTEEVTALDRYLEEERARAQRCLTEAALRLQTAVPGLSPPPPVTAPNGEGMPERNGPVPPGDISDISQQVWPAPSLAETD